MAATPDPAALDREMPQVTASDVTMQLGQIVSMVWGPDGPFLPCRTPAARERVRELALGEGMEEGEYLADLVAACLIDAFLSQEFTFPVGDKQTWWGAAGDDTGEPLAICVFRDRTDDQVVGVVMTFDEARAKGAPL